MQVEPEAGRESVADSVDFAAACPFCGSEVPCSGWQALIFDRLEWSIAADCPACGLSEQCGGGDVPADLRERLIAECDPVRLELPREGVRAAVVMKVVRATLGVGLGETRAALHAMGAGRYEVTLPELERLARRLRAAGVEARAVRP